MVFSVALVLFVCEKGGIYVSENLRVKRNVKSVVEKVEVFDKSDSGMSIVAVRLIMIRGAETLGTRSSQ
jgi:hypothetical protein